MGTEEITERLAAGPPRAGRTRVLGIDGRSGAGKSTLAAAVAARLAAPVVSLDDLYGGWDGLERGVGLLVSEVLEPLAGQRPAQVPRYDWVAGRWLPPWRLAPPPVLIVEGCGAGAEPAARYLTLLVWLEMPESSRKRRALARDGATFAPHWERWAAQEAALLSRDPVPARADLIR